MGTDSVVVKPGLPRVCDTLLHLDVCKRILAKKKKGKEKRFRRWLPKRLTFHHLVLYRNATLFVGEKAGPCLYKVHIGNVYTFLALVFDVASDDG